MTIDEFLRIMREKFGEPNTNDFYDAEPVSDEENEEILREIEQLTEEDLEFSEMEPIDWSKYPNIDEDIAEDFYREKEAI